MTSEYALPLPGLDAAVVNALTNEWSDGGLWEDIEYLVRRFWDADDPSERAIRWHHLVLAVGNFKRQRGRRLRPARLMQHGPPQAEVVPKTSFVIPGSTVEVSRDEATSWSSLQTHLVGAGLATTTTLLAAFWPEDHFVYDRRVRSACNGLRVAAYLPTIAGIEPDGTKAPKQSIAQYVVVRDWSMETQKAIGCSLLQLERSLYELARKVAGDRDRTWREYGSALTIELEKVKAGSQ